MPSSAPKSELKSIRAFYDRALAHKKSGDLEQAEQILRRAVAVYGRDPNIYCLLGEVLLNRKQAGEAEGWFQRTLEQFPGFPRALDGLGRSLLAQRKPRKAAKKLAQAAKKLPDRASTHLALARAYALSGELEKSDIALERALSLDPDKALVAKALELLKDDKASEAEKLLREHLAKRPDDVVALRSLASIASKQDRPGAAVRILSKAVEIDPQFALGWGDLVMAQLKFGHFDEALEAADQLMLLEPDMPGSYMARANVYSRIQRHDEALADYRKALEFNPSNPNVLISMGHLYKTIGQQDESIASFRKCMTLHPENSEAYWSLANFKTFEFSPEEVAVMEEMVARQDLEDARKVSFYFSLGKQYENQKRFDEAFDHYRSGSEIRRAQEDYDPVSTQLMHDDIIETFTPEFLEAHEGWGDPDPSPILVVGMNRSGSTLIEQILASHSQVEGTQELPDLGRVVGHINRHGHRDSRYPGALREMNEDDIRQLGRMYLESTQRVRTGQPFFIDKMPNNFANVGLLHLILPNARVINARRHPLDSCLGTWKQLFFNGQAFSYDFYELGHYCREYRRIMDHWDEVLPGKVLHLHYEDTVRDQEGQTRRLLEFLGLEFEEQCLRFYETERAINTASSEQVRQPIYTGGLNFWRNYEHRLEELIEQLEPLLLELPEEDQPASLLGR